MINSTGHLEPWRQYRLRWSTYGRPKTDSLPSDVPTARALASKPNATHISSFEILPGPTPNTSPTGRLTADRRRTACRRMCPREERSPWDRNATHISTLEILPGTALNHGVCISPDGRLMADRRRTACRRMCPRQERSPLDRNATHISTLEFLPGQSLNPEVGIGPDGRLTADRRGTARCWLCPRQGHSPQNRTPRISHPSRFSRVKP